MSADLGRDAELLAQVVANLDRDVSAEAPIDLHAGLEAWVRMEDANRQLGVARDLLAARLAKSMTDKRETVTGVGTFEKHRKSNRKKWDKDLLRVVLDTVLVDTETGEVTDPSPIDKVLHVWNLGAPRVTALRERGIDPDDWCEVEYGDLTLQKVG